MSDSKDRLLRYLSFFGRVEFHPAVFTDQETNYAAIELVTSSLIAEGLEREVNDCLSKQNGFQAFLRFIAYGTDLNGKFRYMAEVIPYSDVPRHLYAEVSGRFLASLPKVIQNFRHKNPSKERGR